MARKYYKKASYDILFWESYSLLFPPYILFLLIYLPILQTAPAVQAGEGYIAKHFPNSRTLAPSTQREDNEFHPSMVETKK